MEPEKELHKFTYPGKTAADIEKELDSVNVHAGTNNIPRSKEFCRSIREEIGKSCYHDQS